MGEEVKNVGLMPGEAVKRSASMKAAFVASNNKTGKNPISYLAVNEKIRKYLGAWDDYQKVGFSCTFVFDERIADEKYFGIRLQFKEQEMHTKGAKCRIYDNKLIDPKGYRVSEFSIEENGLLPYGGEILKNLFDPERSDSLLIERVEITCRPAQELIGSSSRGILRFSLKDVAVPNYGCSGNQRYQGETRYEYRRELDGVAYSFERGANACLISSDLMEDGYYQLNGYQTVEMVNFENLDDVEEAKKTQFLNYCIQSVRVKEALLSSSSANNVDKFKIQEIYSWMYMIIDNLQNKPPVTVRNPVYVKVRDIDKPAIEVKIKKTDIELRLEDMQSTLVNDESVLKEFLNAVKYFKFSEGISKFDKYIRSDFNTSMRLDLVKVLYDCHLDYSSLIEDCAINLYNSNVDDAEIEWLIESLRISGDFEESACDRSIRPEENWSLLRTAIFGRYLNKDLDEDVLEEEKRNKDEIYSRIADLGASIDHWCSNHIIDKENLGVYYEDMVGLYEDCITGEGYSYSNEDDCNEESVSEGFDEDSSYPLMDKVAYNLIYCDPRIRGQIEEIIEDYKDDKNMMVEKVQEKYREIFESSEFSDIAVSVIENVFMEYINQYILTA